MRKRAADCGGVGLHEVLSGSSSEGWENRFIKRIGPEVFGSTGLYAEGTVHAVAGNASEFTVALQEQLKPE